MNLFRNFIVAISLLIVASCNGEQSTKAKIFERKETADEKLMIKYVFTVDGKPITDSAIIDNKALNGDSVSVKFNVQNPSEHELVLSK